MASITTTFYREIDDITVETVGSITFVFTVGVDSGTGGGTSDYNDLSNKPSINGIELSDNKSLEDLGIATKTSQITNDGENGTSPYATQEYVDSNLVSATSGLQNVYATTQNSDVSGYKASSYEIEPTETLRTINAPLANTIYWGEKYLYPTGIDATSIGSGGWECHLDLILSSDVGLNYAHLRVFKYTLISSVWTEVELFTVQGDDINGITRQEAFIDTHQLAFLTDPTDRIGFQIGFSSDKLAHSITYAIGDGGALHLNMPIALPHDILRRKDENPQFQHVDERINILQASTIAESYTLPNRRQTLIEGVLPNGVDSTFILPDLVSNERNESIVHFKTNGTAVPTLIYSGFTPVWLNGDAISMAINKQYTIVFEQINGIVKTSWGGY